MNTVKAVRIEENVELFSVEHFLEKGDVLFSLLTKLRTQSMLTAHEYILAVDLLSTSRTHEEAVRKVESALPGLKLSFTKKSSE
mgnify:CR=1 FL=1